MHRKHTILFTVLLLLICATLPLYGCGSPSATPTTSVHPTQTTEPVVDASPTTEPIKIIPVEPPHIPNIPLSQQGPWWVFSTPDGLFAINPDGSGLTQFYFEPINQPYINRILTAPNGGHIAYLTGREIFDVALRINLFPWRTLITDKPLTSDRSEPGTDTIPGDPKFEAVRAMIDNQSMAFSPDGRYLAFMAAIDGLTSDLYLYSLEKYEFIQLTDGPSQAYQPVWSPDGKYIVHTGVRTFGTGAGYAMEGIWATLADDSGTVTLYDISESSSEEVIGWVDDQTFVVHSWDPSCGPKNLRTFNIETQESEELWPGYFNTIAFDPLNAVVALGVMFEECSSDGQVGLYHIPTDGGSPFRIVEDKSHLIIWSQEANLFLASTELGTLAIDSNGQFINLDRPQGAHAFPAVAPGSRELAWPGDALWIGPLLGSIDPPQEIFNEPTYRATWDPSGQTLLFFADSGLYIARRPDFIPMLVVEGLDNRNGFSGWVLP